MPKQLTSQERMNRALERRDHDRVPRFEHFWGQTLERWRGEGMDVDPAERYEFDLCKLGHHAPVPFPGRREVEEETGQTMVVVGPYGERRRVWKHQAGTPEHLGNECVTPEVWRRDFRPRLTPERAVESVNVEGLRRMAKAGRSRDRWLCIGSRHVFCFVQTLVGDETFLMAMVEQPDWIREMASVVTDCLHAQYERVIDAVGPVDGLFCYDDLAYTAAPFMSEAMYRDLFQPSHRRTAAFAHDRGMKMILHTDGDVRSLLDAIIEAGVDCLQPLEAKAGMDVRKLVPAWGDRLSFFGNIDMTVALTNDQERIAPEVLGKLEAAMAGRGYVFHSDHSVPPQVSWSTYQYMMNLVEQHGNYQ